MIKEFFLGILAAIVFYGLSLLFLNISFKLKKENIDSIKASVVSIIFVIFLFLNNFFGNMYLYALLMVLIFFTIMHYYHFSWKKALSIWFIWVMEFLILFLIVASLVAIFKPFN